MQNWKHNLFFFVLGGCANKDGQSERQTGDDSTNLIKTSRVVGGEARMAATGE